MGLRPLDSPSPSLARRVAETPKALRHRDRIGTGACGAQCSRTERRRLIRGSEINRRERRAQPRARFEHRLKPTQHSGGGLKGKFPDAQVIKVSKSGGGSSGPTTTSAAGLVQQSKSDEAVTASDKALQDLNKQTGDDYEKTIQHLPDTIKTEGKPPPKDNQPSGAGTGATVIK